MWQVLYHYGITYTQLTGNALASTRWLQVVHITATLTRVLGDFHFTSRPVCDIWLFAAKGVVVH